MTTPRSLSADIFVIATGSSDPIYRQMIEQLRRLILGGQVSAGDEMPSVREVATALGVNPMTVSKAYSLLESDGWLSRRRGMGMVIAERVSSVDEVQGRLALMRPSLERVALEAQQLQVPPKAVVRMLAEILKAGAP